MDGFVSFFERDASVVHRIFSLDLQTGIRIKEGQVYPMARADYYLMLGVSRRENVRGIQEAFRELAKTYPHDRADPEGSRKFRPIQQAYGILSDPAKRKLYDHELEEDEIGLHSSAEPIVSQPHSRPEPLMDPLMSVLRDFESIQPSFEPLFERWLRNFTGENIPKGERLEALNVEVILPAEKAVRGVTVRVGVPVFYTCPQCGGSGRDWLFPCVNCHTEGMIEEEETVAVRTPPMVPDGANIDVPIHGLGFHNFFLRLHIRISP
jgi:molecular chaperone DnaJ